MTNTAALKKVFEEVRNNLASWNEDDESIYSFYRWFVQDAAAAGKLSSKAASPANDLRSSLRVAAMAAYTNGATDKQINYIVALAEKAGRFNVLSGGHLTKADASRIIDSLH